MPPSQRCVLAVGIAQARPRDDALDDQDSCFMTLNEMHTAAAGYTGKPLRFMHDQFNNGDLGQVEYAWVDSNQGKLYTLFTIDQDEQRPWAQKAGQYVLNGWFNALSTATMAIRDPTSGKYNNCISDPLELSLCTKGTARRGPECEILFSELVERTTDGSFKPVVPNLDSLRRTNQPGYASYGNSEEGLNHFSSALNAPFAQLATLPGFAQHLKPRLNMSNPASNTNPTDPGTAAAAAAASSAASSSTPATGTTPATAPPAQTQGTKRSFEAPAHGNPSDQTAAGDDKRTADDKMMEFMKQLQTQNEELQRRMADQEKSAKDERDRVAKEKMEVFREALTKLFAEHMGNAEQQYKQIGKDPTTDPHFQVARNVANVNDMEELKRIQEMTVPVIQNASLSFAHMRSESDKRQKLLDDMQAKYGNQQAAAESMSRQLAHTAADAARTAAKSAYSGLASRVEQPPASRPPASRFPSLPPAQSPATSMAAPGGTPAPPSTPGAPSTPAGAAAGSGGGGGGGTTAMDTDGGAMVPATGNPLDEARRALFETTPYGHIQLKTPPYRPGQFACEQVLTPDQAHPLFPRPSPIEEVSRCTGVPFGMKGMQALYPESFVAIRDANRTSGKQEIVKYPGIWETGKKYPRAPAFEQLPDDERYYAPGTTLDKVGTPRNAQSV